MLFLKSQPSETRTQTRHTRTQGGKNHKINVMKSDVSESKKKKRRREKCNFYINEGYNKGIKRKKASHF